MNDQKQCVLYVYVVTCLTDDNLTIDEVLTFSPSPNQSSNILNMHEMTGFIMGLNKSRRTYSVVRITHTMPAYPSWTLQVKAEVMHAMLQTTTTLVLEPMKANEEPNQEQAP